MSISNDLEDKYRKSGEDYLADAISALLGTEGPENNKKACISIAIDSDEIPGENNDDLCKDISILLKNKKKISGDLKNGFLTDSTEFFSELLKLHDKFC